MCGICGIISTDPRPVEPAVRAMMRAMLHRGPNDEGFELISMGPDDAPSPVLGLGFRRLAILDLSAAGHQPMFNERTGDCLVFNGEIYNFRQLRAQLQCEGVVFRSTSDTEVLLQALCTWGDSVVERLQGMFAFAFYHADSRRILLARDPLGIKPLYVAALPDRLIFASEIRSLLASGLVPKDLDLAGISGMLAYGAVQSPRTVYEHIRSFPAGHAQWIDASIAAGKPPSPPRRTWSFPRQLIADDEQRAAANVRELLRESVMRHLVADVPVGVFLSGGIDSTVIASFAKEYTPRITAFTVGFGVVHGVDEVEQAQATARDLGMPHIAVSLDTKNLPEKWYDWLAGMDSPSVDGFNTYVVSRRLAAEGVVVGLSGLGADELFGGYSTFRRVTRASAFLPLLRLIPQSLWRQATAGLQTVFRSRSDAEKFVDLIVGDTRPAGVARSLRRLLSDSQIAAMYTSTRPQRAVLEMPGIDADFNELISQTDAFNGVSQSEIIHYMGNTLLRDTDANSMRHSLEVRVPFLDLRLVDYVSALPGRLKNQRTGKFLLRKALEGNIPAHVTARPKTGFSLPIGDWMRHEMRESCEAALANLVRRAPLDPMEVARLWQLFIARPEATGWLRPMALVALGNYLK